MNTTDTCKSILQYLDSMLESLDKQKTALENNIAFLKKQIGKK
jgi:uncharacterized protein YaaN involved in tellurite resistance